MKHRLPGETERICTTETLSAQNHCSETLLKSAGKHTHHII